MTRRPVSCGTTLLEPNGVHTLEHCGGISRGCIPSECPVGFSASHRGLLTKSPHLFAFTVAARGDFGPLRLPAGVRGVAIDKSLKRKGRLVRSRNVLKREERVNQMKTQETWKDGQSVIGLPKTRVIKISAKKKVKKKEEGDAAGKAAKGGKAAKK